MCSEMAAMVCSMVQGFSALCCRYLLGDTLSEADVRLFPTIFRFDHVYYLRFLLEKAMVVESYPNLQVCHGADRTLKECMCCCCFHATELRCCKGWSMLQLLLYVCTSSAWHCSSPILELAPGCMNADRHAADLSF